MLGVKWRNRQIIAEIRKKVVLNGARPGPKPFDGFLPNLVCRCQNNRASAFWGFNGGCAKIGAKIVIQNRQQYFFQQSSSIMVKIVSLYKRTLFYIILKYFWHVRQIWRQRCHSKWAK